MKSCSECGGTSFLKTVKGKLYCDKCIFWFDEESNGKEDD